MDMATRMRNEIRGHKAAQAAAGLSVLITGELRQLSSRFAGAVRGAHLSDTDAMRSKAAGYAERAGAVAARTYENLAARGREAMADKSHDATAGPKAVTGTDHDAIEGPDAVAGKTSG